jgi:galactonate dehydratase
LHLFQMHYNAGDFDLFTYLKNPEVFAVKNGAVELLTGPGLGIELDEDLIRKNAEENKDFSWRNPTWRGPDGAIREW